MNKLNNLLITINKEISNGTNWKDIDQLYNEYRYMDQIYTANCLTYICKFSFDFLLLDFLNLLLSNAGKPLINHPTEFVRIRKEDIMLDVNQQLYDSYVDLFLLHYSKQELQLYRHGELKHSFWSFFKAILSKKYKLKNIPGRKLKNSILETFYVYSIVEK
jgi:hypothetical protein